MNKQPMPRIILPMLAKSGQVPSEACAWGFEIKWDGLRAAAYLDNGDFRLLSRNLKDVAAQYPEIAPLGATFPDRRIILDGEVVALSADGRPSFARLQHRMGLSSPGAVKRKAQEIPVIYIIFDILFIDGRVLLGTPYHERRRLLDELSPGGPSWQTPRCLAAEGPALLAATREAGLEGIIAKRLDSEYEAGKRTGSWLKIKNQQRQELVIAGWLPGQGRRAGGIGSLLVGYWDSPTGPAAGRERAPRLIYAGKVGTGFSTRTLAELEKRLAPLRRPGSPFCGQTTPPGAVFADPVLVGEFEFTEWTAHNTLRHPSFKGLRPDKATAEVVRESTTGEE